jgi:hypothetical protein
MLRPYKQYLSSGRVFQNVSLYRIKSVGGIREPSRCKVRFYPRQKHCAFRIACKLNCHSALIVWRFCRCRAKFATAQSPQPWQCRPAQLIKHRRLLNVEIHDFERVVFDELAARFDIFAHQRGENILGSYRVLEFHLQQRARIGVHGRVPELLGIHFA